MKNNNFINNLPRKLEFKDLHLKDNLKATKKALKGLSGIYVIQCLVTGAIYIGSSIDLSKRLVAHLVNKNTNQHLQNAIRMYGTEQFVFIVVEFCEPQDL